MNANAPILPPAPSPYMPSQSTVAGGFAGAATIIIVWAIGLKVTVPPEIAVAISLVITAATSYFTKGGRSIHSA